MNAGDTFRAFYAVPLAPDAAVALAHGAPGALRALCGIPDPAVPSSGAPSSGAPSSGAPSSGAPSSGAPSSDAPNPGGPTLASAGWRVTPPGRIHITLRFLGDTPLARGGDLGRALAEAAAPAAPFPIDFRGWHLLPGPRDPRVLAAGVSDPSGTLPALAAALEASARAMGFPAENRPFLSHATVARRRRRRGGPRRGSDGGRNPGAGRNPGKGVHPPASGRADGGTMAGQAAEQLAGRLAGQTVDRVVLMRSTLGPGGPVYEVLHEVLLGTG